jgi:cytochrome c-type biogenesis protein
MLDVSWAGLLTAMAAGFISFVSPCVLPLIPGYVSFVSGVSTGERPSLQGRLRAFGLSAWFVAGFTSLFVLLGLSAQAFGGILQRNADLTNIVGGLFVIAFGLMMTGLLRAPFAWAGWRWRGPELVAGPGSAYLLGVAFAFGWTPCIGPVLASILVVTATSATSGAALLGAYGLGLGVPFILTAVFFGEIGSHLRKLRHAGRVLNLTAGALMVAMGVLIMTGQMQWLAIYLLETFPALGAIG